MKATRTPKPRRKKRTDAQALVAALANGVGPVTRWTENAEECNARLRREEQLRAAVEELRAVREAGTFRPH